MTRLKTVVTRQSSALAIDRAASSIKLSRKSADSAQGAKIASAVATSTRRTQMQTQIRRVPCKYERAFEDVVALDEALDTV